MPIPVVLSFKVCPPTTEASLILVVIGKIWFLDVQAPGSISLLLSWGVLPHTDFAVFSNSRHPVAGDHSAFWVQFKTQRHCGILVSLAGLVCKPIVTTGVGADGS